MRVIHVAPTVFGDEGLYGGGERYPLELCRALARHVACGLVTFGSRPRSFVERSGLQQVVLKASMHLRQHPAHPLGPGLLEATSGAAVIHGHHMRAAPVRVAALGGWMRTQPRVVTDHGLGGGGWGGLLPRLFDRFACVSRYSATLLGTPAAKTRVIYGGVDVTRFRPGSDERGGVLFVGRITPHKGIDVLIRALPENAALTVSGTGGHDRHAPESGYPNLLRRLARDRDVTFAGASPEEDLPGLYRRAAVFALPSVHQTCYGEWVEVSELLGLSALEAMASATPVIASRIGGLSEVVVEGVTGYLVAPGDVDELRDRIATLLGNPLLARRMGEKARERAVELFTWDRCAERCVEIYRELGAL